jgi:hypothetical protein
MFGVDGKELIDGKYVELLNAAMDHSSSVWGLCVWEYDPNNEALPPCNSLVSFTDMDETTARRAFACAI